MDKFSLREDFLISVGPNKADVLRDLIMREKPKMLVELGGYLGYSAVLFADAMVKAHGGLLGFFLTYIQARFYNGLINDDDR